MGTKIVIVGAGSVGSTIAYALMIRGSAREIVLVDNNQEKVHAEVLDLNHGRAYVKAVEIKEGNYSDCADAAIVIVTAGAKQKPEETRIDLIDRNLTIMQSIIKEIVANSNSHQPIILIVSNPCDILTYFVQKYSGFPREKVIGSGTVLDTSRFRFEIANLCDIDAHNVHGYVIGEHGDSEVIIWSSLRIGLSLFTDFCKFCKICQEKIDNDEINKRIRYAATEIIKAKGYTNYAGGLAVSKIVEAILFDQNSILPVSVVLHGEYNENEVALSVPCIVNANGIRSIMELEISPEERADFHKSATKLKDIINSLDQKK
jgi:L-lactate dehydrogenase